MKIGFAQLNPTVGDLDGNYRKICDSYRRLVAKGAELVLTPELALTGYPPQDLVYKSRFVPRTLEILDELHRCVGTAPLLVGYVDRNSGRGKPFRNAAALLEKGKPIGKTFKTLLPTYDVFDEDRYFEPADDCSPFDINGTRVGVTICEDIWTDRYLPHPLYDVEPVKRLVDQGADLIVNLSASPFTLGKPRMRVEMVGSLASLYHRPIFYCNAVGGDDQLVFDGNSIAVDSEGKLTGQMAGFAEDEAVFDSSGATAVPFAERPVGEDLFAALSLGLKDYVYKCNFKSAVLGLSGGIDSAVVAVIAAHALGAENVLGVTMPTQFSSEGSVTDARALAENLGIKFLEIPIKDTFHVFKQQFVGIFGGLPEDVTEENMQPRLRAMTLMALSNKFGHLLLSTGNKSELAVGYCTIYGDMAGGLAVISDVPKTMVYELARWINSNHAARLGRKEVIPGATITKPPSAELKPNQTDQDTLPPYEVLDEILKCYVEENLSVPDIVARGFDEKTVRWVARRVDFNEYKREQAAPGLKVTSRAFGVGRRMPIAQKYVD